MQLDRSNILLIEDNIDAANEVSDSLQQGGYTVETARTIYQFNRLKDLSHFDLFIVDLMLPDGDGNDVIRAIRSVSDNGIIVLSGKQDEVRKVVALELGADDYVTKPFAVAEFLARVRAIVRRQNYPQQLVRQSADVDRVLTYYGWITDMSSRVVSAPDGTQIDLTKLEFDLWVAFLENQDKVMAREYLVELIRGGKWAGYDRSIDGLVNRVRKKVFQNAELERYLTTVRGVGYRLIK